MMKDRVVKAFPQLRSLAAVKSEEIFRLPAGLRPIGFDPLAFQPGIGARALAMEGKPRRRLKRRQLTNQFLEPTMLTPMM
jgi:hypothetical protein